MNKVIVSLKDSKRTIIFENCRLLAGIDDNVKQVVIKNKSTEKIVGIFNLHAIEYSYEV